MSDRRETQVMRHQTTVARPIFRSRRLVPLRRLLGSRLKNPAIQISGMSSTLQFRLATAVPTTVDVNRMTIQERVGGIGRVQHCFGNVFRRAPAVHQ